MPIEQADIMTDFQVLSGLFMVVAANVGLPAVRRLGA